MVITSLFMMVFEIVLHNFMQLKDDSYECIGLVCLGLCYCLSIPWLFSMSNLTDGNPPLRAEFGSWHCLKWESWYLLAVGRQFTVQNIVQLYVLVSSALPTTRCDMTCTVLKAT